MRLLLLHPWCEQAVSRGLREDPEHNTFERYRDTRLYQDVTRSCDTLVNWTSHGECVKARLYKVMPSSFFIMTSDVVFVEEYHFGTGGRASGKVPTLEVRKGNKLYTQLQGHFEFIWGISEQFQLSADLVTSLRNPVERESKSFEESIRFSRPDLFLNQS
ncbi:MAG: hypothetical protein GY841_03930 [FCB group bacterium]|nr:hypothetical protein [FCB group bacterium]